MKMHSKKKIDWKWNSLLKSIALSIALTLLLIPSIGAEKITFAVITDTNVGIGNEKLSPTTDTAIASIIKSPTKVDLVLHLGNIIAGDFVEEENTQKLETMWQQYDTLVYQQLQKANIPLLIIAGIQDTGSAQARELYAEKIKQYAPDFVQAQPTGSYSFVYKNNLFIILDTAQVTTLTLDKQHKQWLLDKLKNNYEKVDHVFIFSYLTFTPLNKEFDEKYVHYCKDCTTLFSVLDSIANNYGSQKITLVTSSSQVYYKGNYKGYNVISVGALDEPHTLLNTQQQQQKSYVIVQADAATLTIAAVSEPFTHFLSNEAAVLPLIQPAGYNSYQHYQTTAENPSCIISSFYDGYEQYAQARISLDAFEKKYPHYEQLYNEAAQQYNVPYELIKAIVIEESQGNVFPSKPGKTGVQQYCTAQGCLCNAAPDGPYCGLMQVDLANYCKPQFGCDKQLFIKGDPKTQIFAGVAGLQRIKEKGICRFNGKDLLENKNDPQYFMHWFGCYGRGTAGYPLVLKKTGKSLQQITPKDLAQVDTPGNAVLHGILKNIYQKQCTQGIIHDAFTNPMSQQQLISPPATALATITPKHAVTALYYLTPNFKLYLHESLKEYNKISELTKQLIQEINDCNAVEKNTDKCFLQSINKEYYKRQGLYADNELCRETSMEKFIYDTIEKIKACKSYPDQRCQFIIPNQFFYLEKKAVNQIKIIFSQVEGNNTAISFLFNDLLYYNETVAGKLAIIENKDSTTTLYKEANTVVVEAVYDHSFLQQSTMSYSSPETAESNKQQITTTNSNKGSFELLYTQNGNLNVYSYTLNAIDWPFVVPIATNIVPQKKSFTLCYISEHKLSVANLFDSLPEDRSYITEYNKPPTKIRNIVYKFSLQFSIP